MELTERELWLLNFYRNSELHGALLMGRLARTIANDELLVEMTEHCATEARHAALLTRTIAEAGGRLDPAVPPIQERYSSRGGVPAALIDLLVLSETLEHRVLDSYRRHLERESPHPSVRETLTAILRETESEHGDRHAGWIERTLRTFDAGQVEAAETKWQSVDRLVAEEIEREIDGRFGRAGGQHEHARR